MATTPAVSATSLAAVVAAAASGRPDESMAGDAFAHTPAPDRCRGLPEQRKSARCDADSVQTRCRPIRKPLVCATTARITATTTIPRTPPRRNRRTATEVRIRTIKSTTNNNSANTSADAAKTADAQAQIDAAQAVQLAAIQVQLLASAAVPTVQVVQAQAAVAQTATVAPTWPMPPRLIRECAATVTQTVTPDQSNPVAQLLAAQGFTPQTTQTVYRTPLIATQQSAPVRTNTTATPSLIPVATVSTPNPAGTQQNQNQTPDQTPVLPQANQVLAAASTQTPILQKAQSDALVPAARRQQSDPGDGQRSTRPSRQHRPSIPTITTSATPMAANAGLSLANGGAGDAR